MPAKIAEQPAWLLPGSLHAWPTATPGGPPDAANAGTGAAMAIAGTAQAIAFVTVRRLMPFFSGSTFSMSLMGNPSKFAVLSASATTCRRTLTLGLNRSPNQPPVAHPNHQGDSSDDTVMRPHHNTGKRDRNIPTMQIWG